ncbi:MAG: hypothetical protein Q8Q49_05310 [bacterium]|nr:hypothetical protein [bacterium]
MKDTLRGIGVSAYAKLRRRPDPIERTLAFFEAGKTEGLNTAAILGPVSLPKPTTPGENPLPVIRVAEGSFANLSPSRKQRRRGLFGHTGEVVLFANPAANPNQREPVSAWVQPFVSQKDPINHVGPDMLVICRVTNSLSAEENIRRIVGDATTQIGVQFPVHTVEAYKRDQNGILQ